MTTTKRPAVLFHYTTPSGLLGILDSRKLWATHARFLNDAKELDYGLALIRDVLCSYPPGNLVAAAADHLRSSRPAYFLACFSAVDDLLSQWRAYSRNATGYSVGFDMHHLPADHLAEVVYDPAIQDAAVRSAVDDHLKQVGEYPEDFLRFSLRAALLRLAIQFKHPTFQEEREWRLIYCLEDDHSGFDYTSWRATFRASDRFIVPYMEVELPTKPGALDKDLLHLESVRIGPTANPEEARYALTWMLWRYGYSDTETSVRSSDTPLRI